MLTTRGKELFFPANSGVLVRIRLPDGSYRRRGLSWCERPPGRFDRRRTGAPWRPMIHASVSAEVIKKTGPAQPEDGRERTAVPTIVLMCFFREVSRLPPTTGRLARMNRSVTTLHAPSPLTQSLYRSGRLSGSKTGAVKPMHRLIESRRNKHRFGDQRALSRADVFFWHR